MAGVGFQPGLQILRAPENQAGHRLGPPVRPVSPGAGPDSRGLSLGPEAAAAALVPPMAHRFSGTVRPLKRDTRIAAITLSISASRLVPAASVRICCEQSGSCSSGSSTTCQWRIGRPWRSCCY
jgi:hypothetical protein